MTGHARRGQMLRVTALAAVLLLSTLPGSAATAQGTATIVLDPSAGTVSGCDTIEVDILVQDVENLYAANVELTFDPDLLQVVDADPLVAGVQIEPGDLLDPPLYTAKNTADNGLGTIWYAATQQDPTEPVSGSGVLAVIRFRAREPGISDVAFSSPPQLSNRDGEAIPSTATDGTVEGEGPGCIHILPEEATIEGCDELEVEIWIGNVDGLYGVDVRLSFDPSIVAVVDSDSGKTGVQIEIGDLLDPDHLYVTRNTADNSAGTIWLAVTQTDPAPPVNGEGLLATIHLRATGAGTTALSFTYSELSDIDGFEIPGYATGGSVTTTGIAAPAGLTITKLNATTATLSWSGVPGIGEYHLYRDTYAYFTPGSTPYATTTSLSYNDVGALGSSAENYFYVVRAACGNGLESPISNRVGEFDFDLYPGTASPFKFYYNLIGYPLYQPAVLNADALGHYIDPIGSSVYQVIRYDNLTQNIRYWLPQFNVGLENFPTKVGEPYYAVLDSTAPNLVTFAGDVPALGSVSFDLKRPVAPQYCAYNYITVPLDRIDLTTADELAADIGGVYMVIWYDAAAQAIRYRLPEFNVNPNFAVRVGYPYMLCLTSTAPATWP